MRVNYSVSSGGGGNHTRPLLHHLRMSVKEELAYISRRFRVCTVTDRSGLPGAIVHPPPLCRQGLDTPLRQHDTHQMDDQWLDIL